jgi:hypothetical protein
VDETRIASLAAGSSDSANRVEILGHSEGATRVIASLDGWRADTVTIAVGSLVGLHVADDFSGGTLDSRWLALGEPLPYVAANPHRDGRALYPNGDLEWESGALLRESMEVRPGLSVSATVFAPFGGRASPAHATFALVSASAEGSVDRVAPRFDPLIGFTWDAAGGRLVYSVGAQSSSEPVASFGGVADSHALSFSIDAARVVSFFVDGQKRWSASLNALGAQAGTPVQLWIGGRATGDQVAVGRVAVEGGARSTRP